MFGDGDMAYYVFVDNSNVWIEGKFVSAVAKGWAKNTYEAHSKGAEDSAWRIDFGKLLSFATDGHVADVKRAILFGSKPPLNDSLWSAMKHAQFEVSPLNRNVANKEKAIDTGIVQKIDRCLYKEAEEGDIFILIMGDKDFIHSVQAIREEKCVAKVVFWDNASGELISEADEFINLTPSIAQITH